MSISRLMAAFVLVLGLAMASADLAATASSACGTSGCLSDQSTLACPGVGCVTIPGPDDGFCPTGVCVATPEPCPVSPCRGETVQAACVGANCRTTTGVQECIGPNRIRPQTRGLPLELPQRVPA
jgi:hypothetical protein